MEDPDGGRRPKRKRWRSKTAPRPKPSGCFGWVFHAIAWVYRAIVRTVFFVLELIFSIFN